MTSMLGSNHRRHGTPRSRRAMSANTFDGTLICNMSSKSSPAEELSAKGLAVTSVANLTFSRKRVSIN